MINPTVASRRQIAIYHLRHNPKKFKQTTGSLRNAWNDRCALGVIADAFDVPVEIDSENQKVYDAIKKLLGLDDIDNIWLMNDIQHFDFAKIATELEKFWDSEGVWHDADTDS